MWLISVCLYNIWRAVWRRRDRSTPPAALWFGKKIRNTNNTKLHNRLRHCSVISTAWSKILGGKHCYSTWVVLHTIPVKVNEATVLETSETPTRFLEEEDEEEGQGERGRAETNPVESSLFQCQSSWEPVWPVWPVWPAAARLYWNWADWFLASCHFFSLRLSSPSEKAAGPQLVISGRPLEPAGRKKTKSNKAGRSKFNQIVWILTPPSWVPKRHGTIENSGKPFLTISPSVMSQRGTHDSGPQVLAPPF